MPWGWAKRGPAEPYLGGSRGTPEEAKVAHAWPKYEAAYLRDRLQYGGGKYGPGGISEAKELYTTTKYLRTIKQRQTRT